jgi:rod shape-determining protein MreD
MTYVFYSITSLFLIVLQTVILPDLPILNSVFDLTAMFVIYLGLMRSAREGIPVVLMLGVIMDNLSGAPFMVFITTYFWLYVGVRWLARILQVGMRFRLAVIIVAGILLENVIFILAFGGVDALRQMPSTTAGKILPRLLWALIFGPLLILILEQTHRIWDRWVRTFLIRRSDSVGGRAAR